MTRARYADVVVDPSGVPVDGATVDVYDTGTTSHIAGTIHDAATGGATLPNPIVANAQGEIEFWLDAPAKVDLKYTRPGFVTETHTVDVLDALHVHSGTYALIGDGASAGANATAAQLKEWAQGECYELTAITRDVNETPTTATVKWPDGSGGTFTTTTANATFFTVDAYTVTHTLSSKTVTQTAVTRDAAGAVTTKPALTVA